MAILDFELHWIVTTVILNPSINISSKIGDFKCSTSGEVEIVPVNQKSRGGNLEFIKSSEEIQHFFMTSGIVGNPQLITLRSSLHHGFPAMDL